MKANKCQICGRQLTSEQSIALGVGPECAEKRAGFVASCGTTDDELATLAAVGGDCERWLKYFYIEMRNGNQRLAHRWIESARRAAERDEAIRTALHEAAEAAGGVLRIKRAA